MFRLALVLPLVTTLHAGVGIDIDAFGKSLGGWNVKSKSACDYDLSGSEYRTYKPELTPTPDGGVFASIRIDHRRGWLASDDHAVLEVTITKEGTIASAQSNLALQGRTISSDVIRTGGTVGGGVPGVGAAVKVGADLTADLSSKLLREKVVEPGRVNFPAAVRHNYNLLFQAIRTEANAVAATTAAPPAAATPSPAAPPAAATPSPAAPAEAKPAEVKKEEPKKEEAKKDEPKKEEPPKPAAPESSKLEVKSVSGETIQLKK
ncbi:hypothetical protein [Luteolibacter luteus]|uniref:hypothetical protein n=1 Tax=Luteolibacter luteus TaxID=2728835 RepID=UPI00197C672F|nr:hypothetical protein [Luteolibacter luteus]